MSTLPPSVEESDSSLPKGFGYKREAVDSQMAAVTAERDALRSDLAAVRVELERLKAQLREHVDMEGETRAELVRARQQLEQDRQAIQRDKDRVLDAAHDLAEDIQRRAQRRITEEGWELHRARIERAKFIEGFRELLKRYSDDVEGLSQSLPSDGEAVVKSTQIPPEVFAAAADRLFVPPGFEAPAGSEASAHERFSS